MHHNNKLKEVTETYNKLETSHPGPMLDNSSIKDLLGTLLYCACMFLYTCNKEINQVCMFPKKLHAMIHIQTHTYKHKLFIYIICVYKTKTHIRAMSFDGLYMQRLLLCFSDCCITMWKPVLD